MESDPSCNEKLINSMQEESEQFICEASLSGIDMNELNIYFQAVNFMQFLNYSFEILKSDVKLQCKLECKN